MNKIIHGDCYSTLLEMEDRTIDCVITSPPYWGLRDYGHGGQLGLEKTPEEYVAKLVAIFHEIKRVLKTNGTVWLNLGDSYNSAKVGNTEVNLNKRVSDSFKNYKRNKVNGLKEKDLVGIPWRVAFALQADGWYLRQDIIWSKPNPMPESVLDRCTKSHEYIFLLTKSSQYYFDNEAIQEPITDTSALRLLQDIENQKGSSRVPGKTNGNMKAVGRKPFDKSMGGGGTSFIGHSGYTKADGEIMIKPTRNKRSVWSINTKPFSDAHFAVFPEKLVEPMIMAGCPAGGIVLDPFMGSGTTCKVAKYFNRKYIGIELNPEYIKIAEKRLAQEVLELYA